MMTNILITDRQEIKSILKEAIIEAENERKKDNIQLFSIHKVAQILKRSDKTILKLVHTKALRTTQDGKVPSDALDEYLKNA